MTNAGRPLGVLPDGRTVRVFELRNSSGAGLTVMDLGATILSLDIPDRQRRLADVVLGFDAPEQYLTDSPYFGAVVGRYANRIRRGEFKLDGAAYRLAINSTPNALHGGVVGFDKKVWDGKSVSTEDGPGVRFSLRSPDGDEGYPGTLDVSVTYVFTDKNELLVHFQATTDMTTVLNLSQHSYFNLGGHGAGSVLDHNLMLNADFFTPVDETLIPTGELRAVAGTPFDFTTAKAIGQDIARDDLQLKYGGGYDHNFALRRAERRDDLRVAAIVTHPPSGRRMDVLTDQPGLQVYSSNFLDGTLKGKDGAVYARRGAIVLETQHFPDSPNQPNFPATVLKPDERFSSRTVFRFSTAS